jgi:hypothetical protein
MCRQRKLGLLAGCLGILLSASGCADLCGGFEPFDGRGVATAAGGGLGRMAGAELGSRSGLPFGREIGSLMGEALGK